MRSSILIFELIVTPRSICVGTGNPSGSTEVLPCQGHTDVGTPLMQTGLSGSADVLVGIWTAHTPAPAIGKYFKCEAKERHANGAL